VTTVLADTNVLLCFLTGEPSAQAARSRRLLRRAGAGEFSIRVANLVIAEVVWVLGSVYDAKVAAIAEAVTALVLADGIVVDDADIVLNALRLMEKTNVDYTDAFVAASASARGEAVATFDTDFKRLGVEVLG
jgi:predicted nucleic acid-binding protein